MEASERLATQLALQALWEEQPLACDALVSCLAAACKGSRRATVCRPFPAHIVGADGYDAAAHALDALDPSAPAGEAATDTQLRLQAWLLLQLPRRWRVAGARPGDVLRDALASGAAIPPGLLAHACCVLRLDPGSTAPAPLELQQAAAAQGQLRQGPGRMLYCFHGTSIACLHSILQHGLMAASGTRLQSNGALFGSGIYLSLDAATALAFSSCSPGWRGSSIGLRLRVLLVCQVAEQHVAGSAAASAAASKLPEKYVLAPRPSDVVLRWALLLSDDAAVTGHTPAARRSSASCAAPGPRRGLHAAHVCWALTLAYVGVMLLAAAWRMTW